MTDRRRAGARPPKPPLLADDDADLWRRVAASVEPLRRRTASKPTVVPEREVPTESTVPLPDRPKQRSPRGPAPRPRAPKPVAGSELTGIDRRMSQKLARGQVEVDARVDLHGSSRAIARARLLDFLVQARGRGHRTVLVITGKGEAPFARHTLHGAGHFHAPERQGVLRRAVTEWLGESEFTALVSGFQPAHPKHGGGGAFYVRLRRAHPGKQTI
jgi:DNA-nicking Smr family endonuclease